MKSHGHLEPTFSLRLGAKEVVAVPAYTSLRRQAIRVLLEPKEAVHGC